MPVASGGKKLLWADAAQVLSGMAFTAAPDHGSRRSRLLGEKGRCVRALRGARKCCGEPQI